MTDQPHVHVGDEADAFALGALGDSENARIEALASSCPTCAARVGQAEEIASQLVVPVDPPLALTLRVARTFARPARSRANPAWFAVAAAFVIGLLPSTYLLPRLVYYTQQTSARATVLGSLVHSHFMHAQFAALSADAPHAKAIYAHDGSWIYLVSDSPRVLDARTEPDGTSIGSLEPAGNAAALYVQRATRAREIILYDAGRPIAKVILAY
ncbi:MAG TPA: hypothetical protein VMS32_02380 [Verrucomicrobiae bacterium]|jgi:hypothetical protein|nr:hypothetical protein [Verrucomicrobiae bacterium]